MSLQAALSFQPVIRQSQPLRQAYIGALALFADPAALIVDFRIPSSLAAFFPSGYVHCLTGSSLKSPSGYCNGNPVSLLCFVSTDADAVMGTSVTAGW